MVNGYLYTIHQLSQNGAVDFGKSSNFDEAYSELFPELSKQVLVDLLCQYPDPGYAKVTQSLCQKFSLPNCIFGSGSEDLIVRFNQVIHSNEWRAGVVSPLFYRITESLKHFTVFQWTDLSSKKLEGIDVLWLNNPNALTGEMIDKEALLSVISANPKVLFIVDEAGMFILPNWEHFSLLKDCKRYHNLVILSSFSKAFGLSGLRFGFATGNTAFLEQVRQNGPTFPINALTDHVILNILENDSLLNEIKNRIFTHKQEVIDLLKHKNFSTKPSVNNCVYIRTNNPKELSQRLLQLGIITLNLEQEPGMENCGLIRITIHSSSKRQALLLTALHQL